MTITICDLLLRLLREDLTHTSAGHNVGSKITGKLFRGADHIAPPIETLSNLFDVLKGREGGRSKVRFVNRGTPASRPRASVLGVAEPKKYLIGQRVGGS